MSHHSSKPLGDDAGKNMSEMMKSIFGEYPDGKTSQDDEGALAVVVSHENGCVCIRFPKPVAWIEFTPEQAIDIAQTLITHARNSAHSDWLKEIERAAKAEGGLRAAHAEAARDAERYRHLRKTCYTTNGVRWSLVGPTASCAAGIEKLRDE